MTTNGASSATLIQRVSLSLVDDPPSNPNRLNAETVRWLEEFMAEYGYLQPALFRPMPGGRFEIVDGVHRRAVLARLGATEMDAVVVTFTDAEAKIVQVGMNRLRGDLDLRAVAIDFDAIIRAGTASLETVAVAGFTPTDMADLIASATASPAITAGFTGDPTLPPPAETPGAANPRPHALELTFSSAAVMKKVKTKLRKAAGKGARGDKALADGLLALLDIEDEEAGRGKGQ